MCADAFLAGTHQLRREQPLVQWDLGTLEQRADRHRELRTARIAEPQSVASALDLGGAIDRPAMGASDAIGPADGLKMLPCGLLVMETFFCEVCHGISP